MFPGCQDLRAEIFQMAGMNFDLGDNHSTSSLKTFSSSLYIRVTVHSPPDRVPTPERGNQKGM